MKKAVLLAAFLAACAQVPIKPPEGPLEFSLAGRIAARYGSESFTGNIAWRHAREGDLTGAARELRRAYGGRPDAESGAHLGDVLWMLGERDEARRIWDEALKAGPENETLQKTIKRLRK